MPNAENADSVDNSFPLSFRISSVVVAQPTAHRKITVLWLRLPKSLPVLPVVILLYQPSPNTLPMAVHLQRKNFSVELKKRRESPMPPKRHWLFPFKHLLLFFGFFCYILLFFNNILFFCFFCL